MDKKYYTNDQNNTVMILLAYILKNMLDKSYIDLKFLFQNNDMTIYNKIEQFVILKDTEKRIKHFVRLLNKEVRNIFIFRKYKILTDPVLQILDTKPAKDDAIIMKNTTIFREYNVLVFENADIVNYNFIFNTLYTKNTEIDNMMKHYESIIGKRIEKYFTLPE